MRSASRHPHHSVTVTVLPRGVGLVLRPQLLPSARVFKDRNLSLHFDGVVKYRTTNCVTYSVCIKLNKIFSGCAEEGTRPVSFLSKANFRLKA